MPAAQAATLRKLFTTGRALVALHDWTFLLGPNFVCAADTAVLAYVLFRSRLVPRFIPVLGLIGATTLFASAIGVLFGLIAQVSVWGAIAAAPVFAWELCLAARLIGKGFSLPTAAEVAVTDGSMAQRPSQLRAALM